MLKLNFTPFPVLHTQRLLLRQLQDDDAETIFFFRSDERILEHLFRKPATSINEAHTFINNINEAARNNESILWAITFKENPSLCIGTICLWNIRKENYRAEIGYIVHPAYWRKGIVKEAMQKVIDYGFSNMQLHSIDAVTDPANIASIKALEGSGFIKEAHYKEDSFFNGRFWDTAVYSLLNKTK